MTNDDGGGSPLRPSNQSGPQPGYPHSPPYGPGHHGRQPGQVPAWDYPVPPVAPRKLRWPWIVGAITATGVVALSIFGYALTRGGGVGIGTRTVTVTYEVAGDPGPVEIRYRDAVGHVSEPQTVTLPWSMQLTVNVKNTDLLSVRAERTGSSRGSVTCRVIADHAVLDQMRSIAGIAVCGGSPAGG